MADAAELQHDSSGGIMNSNSATDDNMPESSLQAALTEQQDGQASNSGNVSLNTMTVSSDEVNYLIYRYLQESGFVHSAFSFAHESMLGRTGLRSADKTLPPGALITFLQKGLQYVGIEETLDQQNQKQSSCRQQNDPTAASLSVGGGGGPVVDFALLAPATITAISKPNPPIQLNVPPATAAAAIQAKLAAERLQLQSYPSPPKAVLPGAREAIVITANEADALNVEGGPQLPPSNLATSAVSILDDPTLRAALAEQAAAARAAVHLQQVGVGGQSSTSRGSSPSLSSAAATAMEQLLQRTGVGAAELLALQNQQRHQQGLITAVSMLDNSSAGLASDAVVETAFQQARGFSNVADANNKRSTASNQQLQSRLASVVGDTNGNPEAPLEVLMQQRQNKEVTSNKRRRNNASPRDMMMEVDDDQRNEASTAFVEHAQHSVLKGHNPDVLSLLLRNGEAQANNGRAAAAAFQQAHIQQLQQQHQQPHHINGGNMMALDQHHRQNQYQHHRTNNTDTSSLQQHPSSFSALPEQQDQNVMNPLTTLTDAVVGAAPNSTVAASGVAPDPGDVDTAAPEGDILQLQMHESEVFMCAWNSVYTHLIATGSADASARIWEMNGQTAQSGLKSVVLLPHGTDPRDKKNKDVTTLEWSADGEFLATGSYDGVARVWSRSGALLRTLRKHNGPIFSLKWNKKGNYILTGSYDTTTIVWDVSGRFQATKPDSVVQQFTDHQAPALDVDWRDNTTFASCSTGKTVHIYRVGEERPLRVYTGHTDEVNAVKWDPSKRFLASCSDDCTAKIWAFESESTQALYSFNSHSQEIYTVKWSPVSSDNKPCLLATASFDGTVRLWSIADGSCYRVFKRHRDSVYSVAFSPSGDYLASGSLAGQMYIWNIQEGRHVKSYKGTGDIFEVAWNKEETRVAACFSSNVVAVIDFDRSNLR